ncbi:GntR family transcriptional regulator [uncultured Desulfovibrio sp.]|uniref:GntR family transcriptional regulator n=1 Tax=uncultured Desulfovibrio sp. TaxID=167968 RepID=UPI0034295469
MSAYIYRMNSTKKQRNSSTKSHAAYEMIRDMIMRGDALPGTRLILTDLEQRLGVGRGPIRDALLLLDKSGLVQNIPHKGAIVMLPPGFREMKLIYEQRCSMELALAKEAMLQATPAELDALEETAREMESAGEEIYFFHMDREFHRRLYELSRMPHLVAVVEHLMDFVQAFLTLRSYSVEHKELFNQQHAAIIAALRSKDAALLRSTLEKNIMIGLELVHEEMKRFRR